MSIGPSRFYKSIMTANIFSYDFDRVLSPQNFPCTLEEGQDLVNRTHSALKAGNPRTGRDA